MQIGVDGKYKLSVDHDVTNECTDKKQLSSMAIRARETLEVESLEVVADAGYHNNNEIKDCAEGGVMPYLPKTGPSANNPAGFYAKKDFFYDAETDC